MSPHQARLLISILNRLNLNADKITSDRINCLAEAVGAFSDLSGDQNIASGAPDLGRPVLTVHSSDPE